MKQKFIDNDYIKIPIEDTNLYERNTEHLLNELNKMEVKR